MKTRKRDPEVTNPVLLQRATEKKEQAQRRAVHIRILDCLWFNILILGTFNGLVLV